MHSKTSSADFTPHITLAPMEGLLEPHLRHLLTDIGGYDRCITEFIRITQTLLPRRIFYKICPELQFGGETSSKTPVYVQLLGSDPECLADNAAKAEALGASGIDLNFGCPAKTVNKHRGGASLLKEPDLLHKITEAVRKAVSSRTPVTAKMRLGFDCKSVALENALALVDGGAEEITIHARTRSQGYKPPVYWEDIKQITETVSVPIIANGDIWTLEDYQRCISASGCQRVMLGRGAISQPNLAKQIKQLHSENTIAPVSKFTWEAVIDLMNSYRAALSAAGDADKVISNRLKQWLHYFRYQYNVAEPAFEQIKTLKCSETIIEQLYKHAGSILS